MENVHYLTFSDRPPILRRPIMVVGADVTHPAPGSEGISIAAVITFVLMTHRLALFGINKLSIDRWRLAMINTDSNTTCCTDCSHRVVK